MKSPKFTEAQIVFVLKQAEEDTAVAGVCRKADVQPPCYVPVIWRFSKIVSGAGGRMRRD